MDLKAFKWLVVLEVLFTVGAVFAEQQDGAQTPEPDVQFMTDKPGWERGWTHEALEPLYNASLYPDVAVFRARVRLPSALGIANQLRKYHLNSTRIKRGTAVVVVRSGKVHSITFEDFASAYRIRLDSVVSELQRYQDEGHIQLEDTVFILNTRDVPVCTLGYCHVPVFSAIKDIRNGRPYSDDLLIPLMSYPFEQLVDYPLDKKILQGAMASYTDEAVGAESSCRSLVHRFAREDFMAQYIKVLDSEELMSSSKERNAAKAAHVSGIAARPPPPEELARYLVVLSCDYQTANPGLASLLHTNSLVLKGRSYWYEYYYRALQAGVHFLEFEPGSAAEEVKDALRPSSQEKARKMIEEAQQFAYKYLSQRSRALFFAKAISEYNNLFGDGYMQATVADLPKDRGIQMRDILAMKMYPSSWRQGLA
ncbi:hypothetical protein VOLCADRAFT_117922 [Volvox carteri f. nagariensis]|uniref:Glycosyl transferase CAP10 domain-containing protein n=1 Tax=Volvox carteri f. nagariensis TaxID=3068 RepID=D8TZA5_VOLCA|nr:uncharacterized protein VOLCADRAFT_117922 [Volvox carteri f. nagariensis]EFJ47146.1 hypothetical protein VOLCADRAFT_117922 [Volvox carteri f. nagariensis]|eukprot:XP_002951695.1 hypothetical protein VOLCADRAFT_117922 [Volvox carteri f. nagariensis]